MNRKKLFYKLRNFKNEIKLSELNSFEIINEIKNLKVIELDNINDFIFYIDYDNYMIFKYNNIYYFCDTELIPGFGVESLIKIIDFNFYLRRQKINDI